MPADLLKRTDGSMRIDLDLCYLPFVEKAIAVLAACRKRGQDYMPTFGYRSFGAQLTLHKTYLAGNGGKAAPAGLSAHNYGLAWDLCADLDRDQGGLQPAWNAKYYLILGEETEKAGLVWGGRFNDSPHIQWPGFVSGAQLRTLRKIWTDCPLEAKDTQRLSAVWAYLDVLGGRV